MIIDRKNVEDTFKKYTDNYDTSDYTEILESLFNQCRVMRRLNLRLTTPTGWRLLVRG